MKNIEIWKDIPEYIGMYQVSNLGNVKSVERYSFESRNKKPRILLSLMLKSYISTNGYRYVSLCKNGKSIHKSIHQLVAIAFLNHKPCGYKLVVNHIDNNRLNNNINNLEIVTQSVNTNKVHLRNENTGIYKDRKKWSATVHKNYKKIHIGNYETKEDAINARKLYLIEEFKQETILN